MDWMAIMTSFGFPVGACVAMAIYVKTQTENYRSDVKDIQKEHKEEIAKVTEALNNNTLALQKLCDKLEKEVE
jgi:gas vesicle protein